MSEKLSDYCLKNDNKFVKSLKRALDDVIFISEDDIWFEKDGDITRAYIYIGHSLSVYELQKMLSLFAPLYWRVLGSYEHVGFEVWFALTPDWL